MDLEYLRTFVVVADEPHLGRVAARLHLTQPTLSRRIATLERDLGGPLFVRGGRRLTLTPAGELILPRARELIRRADEFVGDAGRAHRGEIGTVRLGFAQSATFQALPALVRAFRAARPDVVLDARAMPSLWQVPALLSGRIDVGLLRRPPDDNGLCTRVVSRDPMVVAFPANHPLADQETVYLADLADEDFVFYARPEPPLPHDPIIYERVVAHCTAAGFVPRVVHEGHDVQTIAALVAAGVGISLLIAPTPPDHGGAVVYRDLADDLPAWELVMAWSVEATSPAVMALLDVAGDLSAPQVDPARPAGPS